MFHFEHQIHVMLFKVSFSLSKKIQNKKTRIVINVNFLIIMEIKMTLLIFLIFSQYILARK